MAIALREYQEEGVADIRDAFKRKNYPVLFVLPTGGGKTFTFCYIADNAAKKGNNTIIIVHRKELLLQASKSLRALGIDHGMISPHFTPAPHKMVQVASVDTLLIRLKKWPEKYKFKLAIFDEAHHVTVGNKWGKAFELMGKPITLGVTATPIRGDGTGLGHGHGGIFKEMVIGPLVADLIEMGMLINPTIYTCLSPPDFSGLNPDKEGNYPTKEVEDRVDKPQIIGDARAHYAEICPGAKTIVFCASIKHARHVVEEFNAAGFRFALLVGEPEMSDAERTRVVADLDSGEIQGVCSVQLVDEGFDLPALQCCIILAPTASLSRYLQRVGRIMRPAPGKSSENTWLLDHVGDVGRQIDGQFKVKHGQPKARREWSLEGRPKRGKKEKDEDTIEMKQCPQCYLVFEPAPSCPHCGYDMRPKGRELEVVDGKIYKLTDEMEEQAKRDKMRAQGAARTVEALMRTGKSQGEAMHIVRARQEKEKLIDDLVADLTAWHQSTGQTALELFGVPIGAINDKMKPKELKDLRARFEAHRSSENVKDALQFAHQIAGGAQQDLLDQSAA